MNPSVQQQLRSVIAEYGHSIRFEPRRVEALLRDLCAHDRCEVSVLVNALNERIAIDLIAGQHTIAREVLLARLAKRLESNLAITEAAARWAVETWAFALLDPSTIGKHRRHEFVGRGQFRSEFFELDYGLTTFEATYHGKENFLVELFNSEGKYINLIFNEIGRSHATKPYGIMRPGTYYLAVNSGGRWAIDITQPQRMLIDKLPLAFSDYGQRFSPFMELNEGTCHLEAEHLGRSNFTVMLLSANGSYVNLLINEIGKCAVETSFDVKTKGAYVLDISARGKWRIALSKEG